MRLFSQRLSGVLQAKIISMGPAAKLSAARTLLGDDQRSA